MCGYCSDAVAVSLNSGAVTQFVISERRDPAI
jgi:hypothetical protein